MSALTFVYVSSSYLIEDCAAAFGAYKPLRPAYPEEMIAAGIIRSKPLLELKDIEAFLLCHDSFLHPNHTEIINLCQVDIQFLELL